MTLRSMALLLPLAAAFAGCKSGQTAAPDGSSGSKDSKGRITLSQLNQEMINYSSWQNARALAIANTIETAAPNEQVRYEAIRMKVEILNTQRSLLLAPDPRDIFTDSWVYAIQRRNYLHEGRARDVFGQWRDDISKTNGELIAELKRIGGLFMTPEELAKAEAAVEAYAGEHPSLGAFKAPAARPSADAKKKDKDSSGGLGELLQYHVTHRDPFKTTFEDLHTAAESIEQVSRSVQSMPEDVRKQVEDVMSSLDESAKNLQETLHQAQLTADAFTATAGSANQLVQSYGKVFGVADESGAETAPPPDPDAPSDLEQLTTAAEQLGSTVVEARGLVSDLDGLLQDSGTLQTRIEGLTRYAVRQVLILIGAVFVAAALYRVLSSRVIKPR
jgi:hypothetical protein